MRTRTVLFALLRSVICGEAVDEAVKAACTPKMLEQVFNLAANHDLAHLLGRALEQLDLPENTVLGKCTQATMLAGFRSAQLEHVCGEICATLEKAGICFMPLKGSVLRHLYPETWMRTSNDIDILVKPEDLEAAVNCLEQDLSYRRMGKGPHDVSLYSPGGIHLELHYDTIESFVSERSQQVLSQVWQTSVPKDGNEFHRLMADEMFWFYHISHMAKHTVKGGCGIRPFLDMWVMEQHMPGDRQKRLSLLEQGGLTAFTQAVEKLSDCWRWGTAADEDTTRLEYFTLMGGGHGTAHNHVLMQQTRQKKQSKLPLSRLFIPYEDLKYAYPILEKHKWLTPVYQVVRWFRLLFQGSAKAVVEEQSQAAQLSAEEIATAKALTQYLDI